MEQEPSISNSAHMGRAEKRLLRAIFGVDGMTPYERLRADVILGDVQKRSECDCGTTIYYSATFDEAHPFLYTKTGKPCMNCYDEIVRRNAFLIKSS